MILRLYQGSKVSSKRSIKFLLYPRSSSSYSTPGKVEQYKAHKTPKIKEFVEKEHKL